MKPAGTPHTYDLFKGVVALILLAILIWLLLSGFGKPASPPEEKTTRAGTPGPTTEEQSTAKAQPVVAGPTATSKPTETAMPTTVEEESALSTLSSPSPTPVFTAEKTVQVTETTSETSAPVIQIDCQLALPTRLKVGDRALVVTNLNMRTEGGITKKLIRTNPAGTELTIIGGPVCEAYEAGAYLWWQVERDDEQNGWSAEASLTDQFYFLEPVE